MGTRARVNIFDGNQILVSIYRQFDGYPDGLGREVADFSARPVINGIGREKMGEAFNGMGDFAAQLIRHLKKDIGNVYIRDTGPESRGEEYSYNLQERDGSIWMTVLEGSMTAFGNPGDSESEMKSIYSGLAKDFHVPDEE